LLVPPQPYGHSDHFPSSLFEDHSLFKHLFLIHSFGVHKPSLITSIYSIQKPTQTANTTQKLFQSQPARVKMQLTSIFTFLAVGLSFVAATEDTTTTSTSTMTKTVTITQCNPTASNCPAQTESEYPVSTEVSSSSAYVPSYPAYNSTTAGPTGYPNATATLQPTNSYPAVTETSVVIPTAAPTSTDVPASGSRGLFIQSGLMMGVLGAGIALLA
jgi:hypothetical protein